MKRNHKFNYNTVPGNYALVTGGSEGLGRCIAVQLAQRGYHLILVALPGPLLESTASELRRTYNVDVRTVGIDLSDLHAAQHVYRKCVDLQSRMSVLINNAGIGFSGLFEEGPMDHYTRIVRINALTTMQLTYLFLRNRAREQMAYIMNIGSVASLRTAPLKAVYSASKHFVKGFSLALREELNDSNVSVTTVYPNGVKTNEMHCRSIESAGWLARVTALEPEQVAGDSVHKMFKGKRSFVPGSANKILLLISRILPYWLVMKIVNRELQKTLHVRRMYEPLAVETPMHDDQALFQKPKKH